MLSESWAHFKFLIVICKNKFICLIWHEINKFWERNQFWLPSSQQPICNFTLISYITFLFWWLWCIKILGISSHGISKAFKQQVRCNQKGLQRLREFVLSETKLRSAESLNLWSQIIPFSKNQKEVLQPTCYLNTLIYPCFRKIGLIFVLRNWFWKPIMSYFWGC